MFNEDLKRRVRSLEQDRERMLDRYYLLAEQLYVLCNHLGIVLEKPKPSGIVARKKGGQKRA